MIPIRLGVVVVKPAKLSGDGEEMGNHVMALPVHRAVFWG